MIIETEKDLLKASCDYLDILERQGHVLWWRDNDSIRNKPGFPDLIVWKKNTWERLNNSGGVYEVVVIIHTLLIELKSPKGTGRLSNAQKAYRNWFANNQSQVKYHIVDSFDKFHALFKEFGIEI